MEVSSEPELLELGGVFGRFVVLSRLGWGGTAVVYTAYDPTLDRKVALKLLQAGAGELWGEEAKERLLREAKSLAKLNHPNVVTVYEVGTVGEQVFIAQELLTGGDVHKWLAEQKRGRDEI